MSRVLCLDVGERRVGIAVSDPLGVTAQPLPFADRKNERAAVAAIRRLFKEYDVGTLVVGWPLTMAGAQGPATRRVQRFLDVLQPALPPHELVRYDERFSTMQAERALLEGNVRRARRREVIDSVAASLILQGFLGSKRNAN